MKTVLELNNITKTYGSEKALKNISLKIYEGDIYALVGRNGAGKTTIMKVITTLINNYQGSVVIFNSQNKKEHIRNLSRVSSIIENPDTFDNLSAYENLMYYCKIRGIIDISKIDESLKFVGLEDTGKKKAKHFSLGMKQRLGLAIALLANPDLLILDEPINGLDPIAIMEFRDLITRINKEFQTTILISSHILEELYHVSTRFGFIDKGEMVKEIDKETLDLESEERIVIEADNLSKVGFSLEKLDLDFQIKNRRIEVLSDITSSELNRYLSNQDVEINSIFKEKVNLETYFKNLIKGGN